MRRCQNRYANLVPGTCAASWDSFEEWDGSKEVPGTSAVVSFVANRTRELV